MATKQRRQPKISLDQTSVEVMRDIFSDSQRLDKHQTCLQRLIGLQLAFSKTNQSIKLFYIELIRNIKYTLWVQDSRSPFGQNNISFIIKYLLEFGKTADAEDPDEMRHEFIDTILEDVVIPYTNSKKADCRINACYFIRRLSDELEDISDDIYQKIRKALLDRSIDKTSSVRAAAIYALHRFQDIHNPNDLAIQAIHFHLKCDVDQDVRHCSLKAMAASAISLPYFIESTRDIKDYIRKTAYLQISEKIDIKCFKIEQRLKILKNGLKDRSAAVKKVVESVLIPSWVKSCNNDLIQLLTALDIQTDIELIEKMLEIYFKYLSNLKISEDSNKTQFNQMVDEFRNKNLSTERIFKVTLNVENVFLWRFLCEFCKTNQIESQEPLKTETDIQNISELQIEELVSLEMTAEDIQTSEAEPKIQKVDLFELLVPDVPYFYEFIEKFLDNVLKQELNVSDTELLTTLLDFEFIFNQFMKVALLLDIGDEPQKKILVQTMHSILVNNNIGDKFQYYINPIMKCLAKNGFTDNNSLLEFTAEIISEIFASIMSQNSDENESVSDDPNRELELKRNQLMADIDKCKTDAQELENEGKLLEAEELHKKVDSIEMEIKTIKQQITINTLSQSSQSSQTLDSETSLTDQIKTHPMIQMRCLYIFSGCLEFGDFTEVNAVMQALIEKVCLPGILSDDSKIRCVATRCLGLVCLSSPQYFKKYLHLLIEIFSKDMESIKMIALQSIFDSLCEHGINIFADKTSAKETEDQTEDKGTEVNPIGFKDDNEEDFITSFKQFFFTQLDSESVAIRQTAAQGVSKLLIHCRMYSPELLSKLIIIWFTPNENQVIIQFIGEFLRLYSLAESQGVIVGQSALEEAFVITLQTIYDNNLRLNSDSLIKFFLKLINDENHIKLSEDLLKRLLECDSTQTKLIEDYLLSAISQLSLTEMETKDLKRFEDNLSEIEKKLENSKSKKVRQKLATIRKSIDDRSLQLTADSAFADDFRSVDENNDQEIEDNIEFDAISQRKLSESDSNADSFETCPESPVQKKRKLSEICDRNDCVRPIIQCDEEEDQIRHKDATDSNKDSTIETISTPMDIIQSDPPEEDLNKDKDSTDSSNANVSTNESFSIPMDIIQSDEEEDQNKDNSDSCKVNESTND